MRKWHIAYLLDTESGRINGTAIIMGTGKTSVEWVAARTKEIKDARPGALSVLITHWTELEE